MYDIFQRRVRVYNHNASPTNGVQVHIHLHHQSVILTSRHKFIHVRPLLHIILMLQQHRQNLKRRVKIQHIRTSPTLNPSDPYARLQQLAMTEINQTVARATYSILTRQIKMPQNLLMKTKLLLMHSRRPPPLLLTLPIPYQIPLRNLQRLLIFVTPWFFLRFNPRLSPNHKLRCMRLRWLRGGNRELLRFCDVV